MPKDIEKVPSVSKVEVASGIGLIPSEAKLHNQLAPSDQSGGPGSASVASKPRSTRRRARRNDQYPARRDNGAVRHPKWKRPNALKSGVYSGAPLIPGEDPREYDRLLAGLMDYWKPTGPSLRFAVRQLADSMWRMERQRKFTQTQLSLTRFDPKSPTFDEVWGFAMLMNYLRSEPEKDFDDQARKYLRCDKAKYLSEKFPRSNYQSDSEWAKALTREILSVQLPATPGLTPPEPGSEVNYLDGLARQWRTDQMVAGCMIYDRAIFEHDDKETERLEARIVRQTRYCAELKAEEKMHSAP